MPGTLYIVSTPIGNLGDITFRAVETLKGVDLIACEDTRHSRILLDRYAVTTPTTSYFEYNKVTKTEYLLAQLKAGKSVALISDAGTPGISDPGHTVITAAIAARIPVVPIPGPAAFVAALVVSGKPAHKFAYEGFLSTKSAARRRRLEILKEEGRTVVLYESPHRILKLLEDVTAVYGDVEVVIARELTKKFEEVRRDTANALRAHYAAAKPKGEFIVII